jgi:hypothetical protein
MPTPNDLPHDVQVDADGKVIITGMFSHRMWVLDPASGAMRDVAIPVDGANPRAVELAANGDWWVVLGAPNKVARYSPALQQWKTHDVGVYAHSVALAPDGSAWFNGHFTRAPEQIGYVNAHGTSTPYNDKFETLAIKKVFGEHAKNGLAVSSTKSMTGHALGAAGGIEAVFSVKAIHEKKLPPTINYEFPDPECDLDYVPNAAREAEVEYVLSNSFGFGGTNACLIFKRFEE